MTRVLILGGYGNFGRFITKQLVKVAHIQVIISGRSLTKAQALASEFEGINIPEAVAVDINTNLLEIIQNTKPNIVIHTAGPFQSQGYDVALTCIDCGVHYIDLADARDFVAGINSLDAKAKEANLLVVSGASSVPGLSSALIDDYQSEFSVLESVEYGITTAQKTTRGLATTTAILSYTGKPFNTLINGQAQSVYGLQGLHARKYSQLGWRLLGYCNVPDLELFPGRYPTLKNLRFYAGLELSALQIILWLLSWLVRLGLIRHLERAARAMLKLSFLFDWAGTTDSGFHMTLSGRDTTGEKKTITFELTARSGDGPYIPCIPSILLAKKIARGEFIETGARPCVGMITKEEYLGALNEMDINWEVY